MLTASSAWPGTSARGRWGLSARGVGFSKPWKQGQCCAPIDEGQAADVARQADLAALDEEQGWLRIVGACSTDLTVIRMAYNEAMCHISTSCQIHQALQVERQLRQQLLAPMGYTYGTTGHSHHGGGLTEEVRLVGELKFHVCRRMIERQSAPTRRRFACICVLAGSGGAAAAGLHSL